MGSGRTPTGHGPSSNRFNVPPRGSCINVTRIHCHCRGTQGVSGIRLCHAATPIEVLSTWLKTLSVFHPDHQVLLPDGQSLHHSIDFCGDR